MSRHVLDAKLSALTGRKSVGDIGVELELEGDLKRGLLTKTHWQVVPEHSLRNGFEFILRKPLAMTALENALTELGKMLQASKPRPTIRCSTHVHVNALDLTQQELYNALGFYYLIEDILVSTQGNVRVGNLFCLRMSDAEGVTDSLIESVKDGWYFGAFNNNEHKYGAVNLFTPQKFGSLEFRFLRPITDMSVLHNWCKLFKQIVDKASKIPIQEHLVNAQNESPFGFMSTVFDAATVKFIVDQTSPATMTEAILANYPNVLMLARALRAARSYRVPRRYWELDDEDSDGGASRYSVTRLGKRSFPSFDELKAHMQAHGMPQPADVPPAWVTAANAEAEAHATAILDDLDED